MGIPLVVAEPTGMVRRDLRRFTFKGKAEVPCVRDWGHDAVVSLGQVPEAEAARAHGDNWPHDDPAWPQTCDHCGYRFRDEDEWQRNDNHVYRCADGTEVTNWGGDPPAPPGTMIRIPWADEFYSARHPQQVESWLVWLPDGGQWVTSQSASGGGHWTVTGTPPAIDVNPSIWHNHPNGWHGFIRNGELVGA